MTLDTDNNRFDWRKHLPVHPAADLFPLMPKSELKEWAEDIRKNGLQQPIVIVDIALVDETRKGMAPVHTGEFKRTPARRSQPHGRPGAPEMAPRAFRPQGR